MAALSMAEHVCLALVVEGVSHGWGIGSLLAPSGDLGRVWSLSRPLTYRAIDSLVDKRLVSRRGSQPGQGRDRVVLSPTAAGRRAARTWLDEPVAHLRDVRTGLLVKLQLRARAGLDAAPLLQAQEATFEPIIARLSASDGADDVVALWRREQARAVRRFLAHALHPAPERAQRGELADIRLSARNQLHSTVTGVRHGEVMSTVNVTLAEGQSLTAAITRDGAEELDLAPGDDVVAVIKSTEVMLGKR